MCYDDHMYCGTCDRHSVECYCVTSYDLRLSPEEELQEFWPRGLCREHDPVYGGPRR